MIVHRRDNPPALALKSPAPIYTPGWREALWVESVPCQDSKPGPLDPEPSAKTIDPPALHAGSYK